VNDPLPKQNTHSVIRTSTPQAKLSTKPTRTSVNNTHTMHVNDTITEHGRTLDGIKTTAGTSTQFSGSHPEQLPQMTIKLSVVFTHGTSVTHQSPGCSGHVRLTANHSSMQLKLHQHI